jgi:hypothetical protein
MNTGGLRAKEKLFYFFLSFQDMDYMLPFIPIPSSSLSNTVRSSEYLCWNHLGVLVKNNGDCWSYPKRF